MFPKSEGEGIIMPSTLIYNKDNWLFENPQQNIVHDIALDDIDQLWYYAEVDDGWAEAIKKEVIERDKALQQGHFKFEFLKDEFLMHQTGGTIIPMPYGLRIISFPSKRQLFRGEIQNFHHSLPSLNRIIKNVEDEKEKELLRVIAYMRKWLFVTLILKINVVPYWAAKLSDVNYDALAQHYGLPTHLMDLTNDFRAALFFATCKYDARTDSYRPLTQEEINASEDTKYGYIFHAPDWCLDYLEGGGNMKWTSEHLYNKDINRKSGVMKRFYLQSGDMDGVALQIGYQPLQRCHHQSGYIYPMRNAPCLQDDWHFEKLRFEQSERLSKQVFDLMDKGKKVFPYEGINELRKYIEIIKHSVTFSKEDLQFAYEDDGVDKDIFPTIDDLKKSLGGYRTADGTITIQDDLVDFDIPRELLDIVNSHYDDKDLLQEVGGMIHQRPEDREYFKQRCIDIYGQMIP